MSPSTHMLRDTRRILHAAGPLTGSLRCRCRYVAFYRQSRKLHQSSQQSSNLPAEAQARELRDVESSARSSGLNALRSRNKVLKQAALPAVRSAQRTILGQSSELPIRARFAPSPTGYLHLGSLRTALFNCLAAKASANGAFILRIEDTDQTRLVADAEDRLVQDLKWAGLTWDEGPDCGGQYGPYKQSDRLPIYKSHVQMLLDRGHAYRCFCSPEQLDAHKRKLHEAGRPTTYPGTCRSIEVAESERRANAGHAHVVRLKGDAFGRPKFRDAIYGLFMKKDPEDDFVILKSDGFPTYHLANVVDDHLMKITHVIRGEEWLISTPKHLALYEAFGWHPPTFAHLGLLVNPDGSKLSKRNDSVNLSTYRARDIFPMALLSWLANLGSSFKSGSLTPRTISDIADALTFKFTRGGIKLNPEKLTSFHVQYRDALLQDPQPTQHESSLLDSIVIAPLLQQIKSATSEGHTARSLLPPRWHTGSLTAIPALTNPHTQASHLRSILSSKRSTQALLADHPYLIWRVPLSIYQSSLAAYTPDQRIFNALHTAIEDPRLWSSPGEAVMSAIQTTLAAHDIPNIKVHETLRLVGAGGHDVVSPSSSSMFAMLGREEWRARLDVVRSLLHKETAAKEV